MVSVLGIVAFTALAVPMGEAPEKDTTIDQQAITQIPQSPQEVEVQAASMETNNVQAGAATGDDSHGSNFIYSSAEREKIYQKLNDIKFDKISFDNVTLADTIRILAERSQTADPEQEGVNFLINSSSAVSWKTLGPSSVKINVPEMKNARLKDVLEAVTKNADFPIKYALLDYGIEFSIHGPEIPSLHTRTFIKVDTNVLYSKMQEIGLASTNAQGTALNMQEKLLNFFTAAGVSFTPPKSIFYNHRKDTLTVHATEAELDLIEQLLSHGGKGQTAIKNSVAISNKVDVNMRVQDAKLLYQMGKLEQAQKAFKEALDVDPNNHAAQYYMDLIKKSRVQPAVNGAMELPNAIVSVNPERQKIFEKLKTIRFDRISYHNVPLEEVANDLTKRIHERDPERKGIIIGIILGLMPDGGVTTMKQQSNNVASVQINLPELKNARLVDVLDAIVKSADYPIQYSIADYGVVFSSKEQNPNELFTRTFRVDPRTFFANLGYAGVLPQKDNTGNVATPDQKRHLLFVKGPDAQIAIVNFFSRIGINLAPPKSVFFNDRVGTLTVHASEQDLDLIEQAIDTLNILPPEVTVKARFVELDPKGGGLEALLKNVLTNKMTSLTNETSALTGILTEPQFKTVLRALEKRDHADLLNEGEVTTLSGRQADFQVMEIHTLIDDFKTTVTTSNTVYGYSTTNMPFGTDVDVVPTILPDGRTVSMRVMPAITEFLGYDTPPKALVRADKNLQHAQLPLPKYRLRQADATVTVSDGQTVVMEILSDETVMLGSKGVQVRQPFKDAKKKQLVVFITPAIIDSSGKRIAKAR